MSYKGSFLYNENANRMRTKHQLFLFCMGIHYTVLLLFKESLTYGEFGGLFLIGVVIIMLHTETVYTLLQTVKIKSSKKREDDDRIQYYINLSRIIEKSKSDKTQTARICWIYIAYHYEECNIISCPLSKLSGMADLEKDTKEKKISSLKQAIAFHFKRDALLRSSSADLKLLYVAFVSRYLKSYAGAWLMLNELQSKSYNFMQSLQCYILRYFLLENLSIISSFLS